MRSLRLSLALCAGLLALRAADPPTASGVDVKAMDPSANPCQNFYQYACGSWRQSNPIPADQSRWSRFSELLERNQQIARGILENVATPANQHSVIDQKIGDFYASCMDEAAMDARGVKPIEPDLARIAALASKSGLTALIAQSQKEGSRPFFNFMVRADSKNSQDQIANVGQGGLTLPDRDYYLKDDPRSVELRSKYRDAVRTLFELLAKGQGKDATGAAARAEVVLNIETALAKAALDRVSMRNPNNTYHKMTVAELAALAPAIDWPAFFKAAGLPHVQTLNVGMPDFMKALNGLIESTSVADLQTYLTWQLLASKANLLPKAFRDADFDFFSHTLAGVREAPPRWKQCVQATDRALGEALGQKYVEAAFAGNSKAKVLQLVGEIEKQMEVDIKTADWMSPATKDQALTKLSQVSNKIGYPDKWRDYSSLKVERGDHFGNALRATEFARRRNIEKFGKPVDKNEWGMTPPTVNAYYNPPENNINFPAGILQPPFYNAKADDAVNYGGIGVVIGHELTHGFDDQGRRYDGSGNLRDWWSAVDAKNFETRADCVVKEYGGFSPVPNVKLNGKLTLGENAADNGGIHLAYAALMQSLAGKVLPKKDGFTQQQLFFLGYAQVWCENSTEQSSRMRAMTDPHSPGEFRVNGVVQNMKEFGEAFSCKAGDPMVSANACRVW
ncbi:MAG: M13 family metallopeptidase [Acidobacteria bacterium]|nr:M13 family metallopeptidase [Acidobacteriota bacterium]